MPAPTGYLPPGVVTSVNSTMPVPAYSPLLEGITSYNVVALGADPTGVADSTGAFSAADGYAANGGLTIVPPGTYRVNATMFHPGWVYEGVQLRPDAGKTLTFAAPWRFPSSAWWGGAGTVAISAGAVRKVSPEWFGAGPGVADSTAGIAVAIILAASLGGAGVGGVVDFLSGSYNYTQLAYQSFVTFAGKGIFATRLRQIAGTNLPGIVSATPSTKTQCFTMRDLCMDGFNNRATSPGAVLITATQNALIEHVWFNYPNGYAAKFQGGSSSGDVQTPRLLNCSFQNGQSGCVYVWLSASDSSKPDYCQVLMNDMESGAGVTGIKATIGPTSGPGVGGGNLSLNTMVGVPTPFDLAALGLRVESNDVEAFASEGITNINVYNKPGVWTGIDGPNLYKHNVYHWTGAFSGSRPVNFVDTAVLKAIRDNDVEPQPGGSTNFSGVPLPSYLSANVPAASAMPRVLIYVSDASAGSNVQFSNGASWLPLG